MPNQVLAGESIQIELNQTDFGNARAVTDAINRRLAAGGVNGAQLASARDARVIQVPMPDDPGRRVAFLAELENLDVTLGAAVAKVIVNARTGSVVMNQAVSLMPSAVAHGSLSVTVASTPLVSQPAPFSQGSTVVAEKADITIRQEGGAVMMLPGSARLTDVVSALNSLGASPQDLIAILQALKVAGSLKAELEII